jgi:ADP-heptose:LPS heptosyltransferase
MGLFVLASPYISLRRIRRMFRVDTSIVAGETDLRSPEMAGVVLSPHFCLVEALTLIRAVCPDIAEEIKAGIFYRPFKNAGLERWVRETRERFGMCLLSRRRGYGVAADILRANGRVGVLFDQHAGAPGTLSLFMGRLASTSELAGLLAERHKTPVFMFYMEREGFWRGKMKSERLTPAGASADEVTVAGNIWLENKLRSDENLCADWLWLHKRWKINDRAKERLTLNVPHRSVLARNIAELGLSECPREERFWVSLPANINGALAAIPVVRAIHAARPDARVTLLADGALAPLLRATGIGEQVIALPRRRRLPRLRFFLRLRRELPDTHILLGESLADDIEAWLAGAPQRFGIRRAGLFGSLPLFLTHKWKPPMGMDATRRHQTRRWADWLREAHGLVVPPDFTPLRLAVPEPSVPVVGLLCGVAGAPQTRWPAEHWRDLILLLLEAHPDARIRLLGSERRGDITRALAQGLASGVVQDWVGKTPDTAAFVRALSECRCVAGCDNGALHLANMLGVPVVGIYGPTNPVRNGPVFKAPAVIVQPAGCPSTGGSAVADVIPSQVLDACSLFF